jgi:nitrogen fixation/metabolism regulation signal transduction histidine kinase
MMKRARRTGLASREFEMKQRGQIMHLAVTVSALEKEDEDRGYEPPRFVVVLEDMSDLLRAQKSAAWNEVARRVAHEIKNPLTPIALSAERMSRLLDRIGSTSDAAERDELRRRFDRCTDTIVREVESLRTLVDEFSQFARFPTARPERTDLNEVIRASLDVFQGRLDGVKIRQELAAGLPTVYADPEQFKRVIVNLIDNAAEALQDSWVKEILISTAPGPLPESVELVVADSGNGISAEDKEKLFLPYFSTKKRGTGLGLAIVNRVLTEHRATIRVEDNRPSGSRFIIEIPTAESEAPVAAGAQA